MKRIALICLFLPFFASTCSLANSVGYEVGSEAFLTTEKIYIKLDVNDDKKYSPVSADLSVMNDLYKAASLKDSYGIKELITSLKVYWVEDGTRVLILERHDNDIYKVRVLEGVFKGRAGYVKSDSLVKER